MDYSSAECQSFSLACRFSFLVLLLEEIKFFKKKKCVGGGLFSEAGKDKVMCMFEPKA